MIEGIPLPVTDDPIDAEFWRGTCEGKLLVQCCSECQHKRFPPRPMCPQCQSDQCEWQELSGRGTIWSYTVPRPPLLPAFEKLTPYVTALVELEEDPQLRMIGPLLKAEDGEMQGLESATIGTPVKAVFKPYSEDVSLVCWAPESDATGN